MGSNYVRGASVTATASQDEIQRMLADSGATGFRCTPDDGRAAIAFSWGGSRFRIVLALPHQGAALRPQSTGIAQQEAARRRWRQLAQLIRAKLDAVASGIVTFDQEFLAYMVAPQCEPAFLDAAAPTVAGSPPRHQAQGRGHE